MVNNEINISTVFVLIGGRWIFNNLYNCKCTDWSEFLRYERDLSLYSINGSKIHDSLVNFGVHQTWMSIQSPTDFIFLQVIFTLWYSVYPCSSALDYSRSRVDRPCTSCSLVFTFIGQDTRFLICVNTKFTKHCSAFPQLFIYKQSPWKGRTRYPDI